MEKLIKLFRLNNKNKGNDLTRVVNIINHQVFEIDGWTTLR